MPDTSGFGEGFPELDDASAIAYRQAVRAGRFSRPDISALGLPDHEVVRVERTLVGLHLLLPMPGEPDVLVPVSPDAAIADLVGPTEHRIRDLQQSVTDTRTRMLSLLPAYFEGRRERNRSEAFDVITDVDVVQAMVDEWANRCQEMFTAQPGGPRSTGAMERARPKILARLHAGVRIRHLYQHTVRSDLATTAYIRAVTEAGAEVRTTDQLIDRMIINDREIVFLPEQNVTGRAPGAAVIREPTLVAFLCKVYDHLWAGAVPFTPGVEEAPVITDDLKRAIIKLMAQGHKDEMVARRLGMSVRTCRRHISQIMEEVESTSRFQAGVNVAQSGMLDESVAHYEQPQGRSS